MGHPTVIEVSDVESSTRFLENACGLKPAGCCGEETGGPPFRLLESACGSTGVLLVPKAAGLRLGLDSYGAITVPTDGVRVAASSAVNAGARLMRSYRVPLPEQLPYEEKDTGRESGAEAHQGGNGERIAETGIACVEGPDGIRVLLVDRRLLGWQAGNNAQQQPVPQVREGVSEQGGGDNDRLRSSNDRSPRTATNSGATPTLETRTTAGDDMGTNATVAIDPSADREARLGGGRANGSVCVSHPLLTGLSSLAAAKRPSQRPVLPAPLVFDPANLDSAKRNYSSIENGTHDECRWSGFTQMSDKTAAATADSENGDDWFSEAELLLEPGPAIEEADDFDAPFQDLGRRQGPSLSATKHDSPAVASLDESHMVVGLDENDPTVISADQMHDLADTASRLKADGDGEETPIPCVRGQDGGEEDNARLRRRKESTASAQSEWPFRQLEVLMVGNSTGPYSTKPNTLKPVPIDNDHFRGEALLLIKRDPMDQAYAHMFEGKNRMFEVQVQGTFKKKPEGDLFIALEITQQMKLGLLTQGLCKVLLSFGQRMNKQLHYSFGTKDDSELPHIAFPLASSVDSLIRTPKGEEPPVLGQPFQEDKESKANRKKMDSSSGFGSYETGYTYSFSFHSMYLDIANWSTCKIPIMRDIDLHTFWGNSALRVTAYVMKPLRDGKSNSGNKGHLQSELNYVFCVQMRHLSSEEQGQLKPEDEAVPEEVVQEQANRDQMITQPLLTDRSPSPRGRQMSACGWVDNDDASDGDEVQERRAARRLQRSQETLDGIRAQDSSDSSDSDDSDDQADDYAIADTDLSKRDLSTSRGAPSATEARSGETPSRQGTGSRNDSQNGSPDISDGPWPAARQVASGSSLSPPTESRGQDRADTDVLVEEGEDAEPSPNPTNEDQGAYPLALDRRTGISSSDGIGAWTNQTKQSIIGHRVSTTRLTDSAAVEVRRRERQGDGTHLRRDTWACGRFVRAGVADDRFSLANEALEAHVGEEDEDAMVRCPAYVDLYARSPKLKGTWTVFVVVRRGGHGQGVRGGDRRGSFWLRSSKNLSILPSTLVPATQYSPRLSRRETKRRRLDAALQLLTAPTHAHLNKAHQVFVRALMGMESSADRAYRAHSPAPPSHTASRTQAPPTVDSACSSGSSSTDLGPFHVGVSTEVALPADGGIVRQNEPSSVEPSPPDSPAPSALRFDVSSGKTGGSLPKGSGRPRRSSRAWGAKPSATRMEGMVLRALSEHHMSQQLAVLSPSSLTFSRPRKKCLRISTDDIIHVTVAGTTEHTSSPSIVSSGSGDIVGGRSGASWSRQQLIPGMYPVEIHTVGRVHYMLVEGLEEAMTWAEAIRAHVGAPTSPREEVSLSDPFSQYMTKKSAWKASNFWVLNCRRAELSVDLDEGGWGNGCWWAGGLGNEECGFVEGLLRQALELNVDSKREQLITFLDNVCKLRWMPLDGLAHNEQLSLFLNLYHVMLLHSFFLLGPPGSPLRMASYLTTLCYEIGGDIISMAEVEHCILRAKTSAPKKLLSKLIIPTTDFPFALRKPERRVSFALNCGSLSISPWVAIYSPPTVEEQIEEMSTLYLQNTVEVNVGKKFVTLPKIVQWYLDDFSKTSTGDAISLAGSGLACLLQVKQYIVGEKRRQVESLLADGGMVQVKFSGWTWRCRPLKLVDEAELGLLREFRRNCFQ